METLMVMFFNWLDLWLAVTIILPFTPAGAGETRLDSSSRRVGGDRKEGGKEGKANTRATGNIH